MVRRMVAALLVVGLLVGTLLAADGVVVSYAKSKLVVKVDGKERTIVFAKGRPHLHAADGKLIKLKDYPKHLKAGVKVELEEEGGKVHEVTIKE